MGSVRAKAERLGPNLPHRDFNRKRTLTPVTRTDWAPNVLWPRRERRQGRTPSERDEWFQRFYLTRRPRNLGGEAGPEEPLQGKNQKNGDSLIRAQPFLRELGFRVCRKARMRMGLVGQPGRSQGGAGAVAEAAGVGGTPARWVACLAPHGGLPFGLLFVLPAPRFRVLLLDSFQSRWCRLEPGWAQG